MKVGGKIPALAIDKVFCSPQNIIMTCILAFSVLPLPCPLLEEVAKRPVRILAGGGKNEAQGHLHLNG